MAVVQAHNINRGFLLKASADNMGADIITDIVDFREMLIGSIQAKWEGNDAADGMLVVEGSNNTNSDWFDEVVSSEITLDDDNTKTKRKTRLFNLGVIGFRYARVKYFKGSNTTGVLQIIALGKK